MTSSHITCRWPSEHEQVGKSQHADAVDAAHAADEDARQSITELHRSVVTAFFYIRFLLLFIFTSRHAKTRNGSRRLPVLSWIRGEQTYVQNFRKLPHENPATISSVCLINITCLFIEVSLPQILQFI